MDDGGGSRRDQGAGHQPDHEVALALPLRKHAVVDVGDLAVAIDG